MIDFLYLLPGMELSWRRKNSGSFLIICCVNFCVTLNTCHQKNFELVHDQKMCSMVLWALSHLQHWSEQDGNMIYCSTQDFIIKFLIFITHNRAKSYTQYLIMFLLSQYFQKFPFPTRYKGQGLFFYLL